MLPTIRTDWLTAAIDKLATISDAPAPAVTRILFTPTELAGRAFIRQLARELGLAIREDALGNIFMRWEGAQPDLAAVATGSHIDAIPLSGKYDGVVGVIGALEAIHALQEMGFQPQRSLEVIMFTAEEPTRFGLGCLGSRALCGQLSADDLRQLRDKDGRDLDTVRQEAGYKGDLASVALPSGHYHAFVELHIEQGPRLERAGIALGVVSSIAAPATLRVLVAGEGGHAGAVLMPHRRDALLAAAEIALAVERIALESLSPNAVATTGLFQVSPGAVNSIPSQVKLEIDMRDTQLETRDGMVTAVQAAIHEITQRRNTTAEVQLLNADPPAVCGAEVVAAVNKAAEQLHLSHMPLVSRAYHDALFMAQICPTGMIFVPSKNGYSHRPEEYTSPEQIAHGVKTLALALAELSLSVGQSVSLSASQLVSESASQPLSESARQLMERLEN